MNDIDKEPPELNEEVKKKSVIKRVLLILLAVFVILALVVLFILTRSKPEPESEPDFNITLEEETELEETQENTEETTEALETDTEAVLESYETLSDEVFVDGGYKHYLLLGVDSDTEGYKGKRSDAIIILSVSSELERVVLTSIPRDVYVYIEGKGYDKLTHAYAYGQAKLTSETIETNFDIKIEKYFTINFGVMEDMVDLIGGIPMYLTAEESSHMSTFFGVRGTTAGDNILTGIQALTFCRIRKIDSDFKRTERQYKVLLAIYNEVKDLSVSQYTSLIKTVYDNIYTDAAIYQCLSLASDILNILNGNEEIDHYVLFDGYNGTGKKINGTYYYVVYDMVDIITAWREYLGVEDYEPSERIQAISNEINKS